MFSMLCLFVINAERACTYTEVFTDFFIPPLPHSFWFIPPVFLLLLFMCVNLGIICPFSFEVDLVQVWGTTELLVSTVMSHLGFRSVFSCSSRFLLFWSLPQADNRPWPGPGPGPGPGDGGGFLYSEEDKDRPWLGLWESVGPLLHKPATFSYFYL